MFSKIKNSFIISGMPVNESTSNLRPVESFFYDELGMSVDQLRELAKKSQLNCAIYWPAHGHVSKQ